VKVLTWRKGGLSAAFVGMRNTTTGELRESTAEERAHFIANFKGKELLEEPITEREQ
jgi:hypothetical protein